MISFWANRASSHAIPNYCSRRGQAIADHFDCHVYEDISPPVRLRPGAHIFAALDRLTPSQRDAVAVMHDALTVRAPEAPVLNDPRRALRRFELLEKLHDAGINAFQAFGARDIRAIARFPVFLREADRHDGPLTGLLRSHQEVSRALRALRVRGWNLDELLAVEFCDTSDGHGVFRKYSAFTVGDRIVPCHVLASHQWSVKSESNELDETLIRANMAYIESNPHERWLRKIFSLAGAGYGRIDYGLLDGVPQVWEINLNPTIGMAPNHQRKHLDPPLDALREQEREAFHSRLRDAFVSIDRIGSGPAIEVTFAPALCARLARDAARTRRRQRTLSLLHRVYENPRAGGVFRAVYRRVLPRS